MNLVYEIIDKMVRTSIKKNPDLENVLIHTNSGKFHKLTSASALPIAKYWPVGSNSIQIQLAGCAFKTCRVFNSG